jgi:Holliday junction resolvase RusA-like endonuclease
MSAAYTEAWYREQQGKVRGGVVNDTRRRDTSGGTPGVDLPVKPRYLVGPAKNRIAGSNPAPSPLIYAITGQLPSGKNQVQLLWRNGKVHRYPNKTFTNWRARAYLEILEQRPPGPHLVMTKAVRLTCDYWPGNLIVRDVSGQLDALFSLLVHANIIKDDGLIYDVIWRRHALNRKFPKVVLELTSYQP